MPPILRLNKMAVVFEFLGSLSPDLPDSLRELHLDHNQIQAIELEDLRHYGELYRYKVLYKYCAN